MQQHRWLRRYAKSRKVAGLSPNEVTEMLSNLPNHSSHAIALEFTQPLTEMSTWNFPGGEAWLVHKADNSTAICEPIV
jgi:hypothetical protein